MGSLIYNACISDVSGRDQLSGRHMRNEVPEFPPFTGKEAWEVWFDNKKTLQNPPSSHSLMVADSCGSCYVQMYIMCASLVTFSLSHFIYGEYVSAAYQHDVNHKTINQRALCQAHLYIS